MSVNDHLVGDPTTSHVSSNRHKKILTTCVLLLVIVTVGVYTSYYTCYFAFVSNKFNCYLIGQKKSVQTVK